MTNVLPAEEFDVLRDTHHRGELPPGVDGEVLATLLGQAVQHGGALRGLFIVRRNGETRIEAEATTRPDTIVVRRVDTLPGPSDLPDTVLRHVLRAQEPVVLQDAGAPTPFSNDPYLIEHRVCSLLCLPVVPQGMLMGAL